MIFSKITPFNADIYHPVALYLALRNKYRKTCLLESNDYHSRENSTSFIGLEPIVEIRLEHNSLYISYQHKDKTVYLNPEISIIEQLQSIVDEFEFQDKKTKGNGFFGRFGFEFALLTENKIPKLNSTLEIPDLHLFIFKHIIVIDHFTDNGYIISNSFQEDDFQYFNPEIILKHNPYITFPFETTQEEISDFTDEEFAKIVIKAKQNCLRGDVFQLVVSNAFSQEYFGDDFNVYRQLRRLNPSPYLFYFDFETYRLFGSSPEAQLILNNGKAEIHPIAGTVPKTGNTLIDNEKIEFLIHDEKENSEHTMLVDLARNDLSKDCENVKIEVLKELQNFSHVIHLVSKVTADFSEKSNLKLFNNTFPAGTLSGTPKPMALELISKYEKSTRDYYGGAVGNISPNGNLNMAIVIRSVLSKNNQLHYRAGAGVVLDSIVENEVNEVHHKLKAVRTAIKMANENRVLINNKEI